MLMVLPSPVSRISAMLEEVRQTSASRGLAGLAAKGTLQMNGRHLAQLASVLLLAGSTAAFAQCETKEMNENFVYIGKGGVGSVCVNDYEQSEKFCIDGGKIATYKYDIVDEKNMDGTTELTQLDDQCIEARTTGHAKEASRTPNGWLCKPAERTVLIHVSYCQ
jgi:hypothetical protein